MHSRQVILTIVVLLLPWPSFAQEDTSVIMEVIEVVAPALRQEPLGTRYESWEAEELSSLPLRNVGDLLQQNGSFIKSYGPGSIATSTLRGGSASHTAILWNGLPLGNPMLGQADLSLLPIALMEEVSLQYGGHSSNWGSGSVAGTINLKNRPRYRKLFSLSSGSTVGSFGGFQQQLKLNQSGERFHSSTKIFYHRAENDFPYPPAPGSKEINQTNNALRNAGGLQSLYWKPSQDQEISFHGWVQQTKREIPPQINQTSSLAHQSDQSIRLQAAYKLKTPLGHTVASMGWFGDEQKYEDPMILVTNENSYSRYLFDLQHQLPLSIGHLQMGTTQSATYAKSGNYAGRQHQYQGAIFANFRINRRSWSLQTDLRQSWTDKNPIRFIPAIAFRVKISDDISVRGRVSRDFRLPALNDLYWRPGGNSELLPERGWSEELGLRWKKTGRQWETSYEVTGFNRNIQDWILWSPIKNQPFWGSQNIARVWSRGMEQSIHLTYQNEILSANLTIGYDWIKATNQVAIQLPELDVGDPLWYVPEQQWRIDFSLGFNKLSLHYNHQQKGSYASLNGTLPGYSVANISAKWKHSLFDLQGSLQAYLLNAWDSKYTVVENRPMPGRHYSITYIISFTKINGL